MFRSSPSRQLFAAAIRPSAVPRTTFARRFISTAPPHKRSRSWKNSFVRWGLAGALVYYYNTSSFFADEPTYAAHAIPETHIESEQEPLPTIEELAVQRQARKQALTAAQSSPSNPEAALVGSPDDLEEEASQQGAFNEETGEINWDCPCLGGMAHGPCGEEFRAAFSCFVFSKEEPKGVDCIEKFKGMQDCFREHPDVYGSELEEDEEPELIGEGGVDDVPEGAEIGVGAARAQSPSPPASASSSSKSASNEQAPLGKGPLATVASVKETTE